ncbi:MAG: helix-turn-helix domain-containing protein [Planctomycetes bacterium]|nr:helix-turn-helix domain-containing protein [Planctomycetota bacterium]
MLNEKPTPDPAVARTFGAFFKARRISLGKTLRVFCLECHLDPGNISKLERGLLPPPQSREKLEEYARCLKLKEGSADWYELFDLASVETGRIPPDLQEEKFLRKLPAIFRTLRGRKLTGEQLDSLARRLPSE